MAQGIYNSHNNNVNLSKIKFKIACSFMKKGSLFGQSKHLYINIATNSPIDRLLEKPPRHPF